MPRYFIGMQGLAKALRRLVIEEPITVDEAMGAIVKTVEHNVKAMYGDATRLQALSEATQDIRESLGYARNTPLLRDGTLLRDSVFSKHAGPVGEVGSTEPIAAYQELGSVNVKFNTSNPPRPVFRYAIKDSEKQITEVFEGVGNVLFNAKRVN